MENRLVKQKPMSSRSVN